MLSCAREDMKRLERPIYHRLTSLLGISTGTQAILILLLTGTTRYEDQKIKITRKAEV